MILAYLKQLRLSESVPRLNCQTLFIDRTVRIGSNVEPSKPVVGRFVVICSRKGLLKSVLDITVHNFPVVKPIGNYSLVEQLQSKLF